MGDHAEERVKDAIEVLGDLLREESESQLSLFLEQPVLAAIAPVGDDIR